MNPTTHPARSIAITTLGCRLNQYESEALMSVFQSRGYRIVDNSKNADVVVINTCTITGKGEQKSRSAVNSIKRNNPGAVVVVCGCSVEYQKQHHTKEFPADFIVDNEHKAAIPDLLDAHFSAALPNRKAAYSPETGNTASFQTGNAMPDAANPAGVFAFARPTTALRTRAMIKIQDGCNHFCTYCIVPHVRGRAISRPAEAVLAEAVQVINLGFKEIVLTGVDISSYSEGGLDFVTLITRLLDLPGEFRLRLSSVEPHRFPEGLIPLFAHPGLCSHLHLCLQSGSDAVLKRMNRKYTSGEFIRLCAALLSAYPDFNLTTDVITGFPGETDEDFNATVRVITSIGFSHIHTFPFSARKGTKAASMPGQIPERIRTERSAVIRDIALQDKRTYYASLIGKEQNLLIEKICNDTIASGYGELYVPIEAAVPPGTQPNAFLRVTVSNMKDSDTPVLCAATPTIINPVVQE